MKQKIFKILFIILAVGTLFANNVIAKEAVNVERLRKDAEKVRAEGNLERAKELEQRADETAEYLKK